MDIVGRFAAAVLMAPHGLRCKESCGLSVPNSKRRLTVDYCGIDIGNLSSHLYITDYRGEETNDHVNA